MIFWLLICLSVICKCYIYMAAFLYEVPLKFMPIGTVIALVCINIDFVCMQWYVWTWISFHYLKGV